MPKAAFFCNHPETIDRVYGGGRRERIAELTECYPEIVSQETFETHADKLKDLEVIFSTWGMPALDDTQLDRLPNLKAVFYAAGTVKDFAEPFLKRGILVMSAWGANAYPVAEYTVSQILLATKGFFRNIQDCKDPEKRLAYQCFTGNGNYGETVALLGAGQIGRLVIELLKPYTLKIIVHDPYLAAEDADALGVESVSLEDAFARGYVVSNHVPNIPATQGMITGSLLGSMRENATFINTGRGAQVVEPDLIEVLQRRSDLTALLDVTLPEPPEKDSPFYTLPNVYLTSHIAGSLGDEVLRMADFAIEQFENWQAGRDVRYAVTLEMLPTMA